MFCFGAIFCNLVVQITILSPFMVIWFRVNKIKHTVKVKPLHKLTCTVLIYSEIKAHSLHVLLPMNSWIMYDSSIKCMLNCKQCLLFTFSWCAVWVKVHVPNYKFFELLFTSSHTLKGRSVKQQTHDFAITQGTPPCSRDDLLHAGKCLNLENSHILKKGVEFNSAVNWHLTWPAFIKIGFIQLL